MEGQTDGGDYNIPFTFLKKLGDKDLHSAKKAACVFFTLLVKAFKFKVYCEHLYCSIKIIYSLLSQILFR